MIKLIKYNPRSMNPETMSYLQNKQEKQKNSLLLFTCQRFEIYEGFGPVTRDTAEHLFRLTAGMDSVFIGDPSIQGQVKKAYQKTIAQKSLDKYMHRLFQLALHTGKLVRHQTGIAQGAINYPQATINLIKKKKGELSQLSGIVIGVNKLTDTLLTILKKEGVSNIHLLNRSSHHGNQLALKHGIPFTPLAEKEDLLLKSQFIITCTSSREPLINSSMISGSQNLLIDLAVPGNIDPRIARMEGIELLCIADIEASINQNLHIRRNEIAKAERIIQDQLNDFINWQQTSLRRHELKTKQPALNLFKES